MIFARGRRSALWVVVAAGLTAFFTFMFFNHAAEPWFNRTPAEYSVSASSTAAAAASRHYREPQVHIASDSDHRYYRIGAQYGNAKPNSKDAAFLKHIVDGSLKVAQEDPRLIRLIQKYFIIPPSNQEYDVRTDEEDTSMGQAAAINDIFNGKTKGFFVECGALDGETRSNTYFFERSLHWKGILIEADPKNFELLLRKHRKSFALNACLSTTSHPVEVIFMQNFNIGQITNYKKVDPKRKGFIKVLCFPFYSVMLALNRTTVDYFSLDVEGAELDVLKTIPFRDVNIRTLSVEYVHVKKGAAAVRKYMETNGFKVHTKVVHKDGLANDFIFKKGRF